MWLQLSISIGITAFMMSLVWEQIRAASRVGLNTVEQVVAAGKQAQSFDRHYGMVMDFVLIAPFTGLSVFLCGNQWTEWRVAIASLISLAVTALFTVFWKKQAHPDYEDPHNSYIHIAVLHAAFMAIVLAVALLVVFFTPAPQPVLLLAMCVVMPAFLFVGQHMFLGLINFRGDASSYPPPYKPLKNWVSWGVLVVVATGLIWRTIYLVPSQFWTTIAWS